MIAHMCVRLIMAALGVLVGDNNTGGCSHLSCTLQYRASLCFFAHLLLSLLRLLLLWLLLLLLSFSGREEGGPGVGFCAKKEK